MLLHVASVSKSNVEATFDIGSVLLLHEPKHKILYFMCWLLTFYVRAGPYEAKATNVSNQPDIAYIAYIAFVSKPTDVKQCPVGCLHCFCM